MLILRKYLLLWGAIGCLVWQTPSAQTRSLQLSSDVSLSSLVEYVYQHNPDRYAEQAQQQQIDANNGVATALFADTTSINVSHFNDAIGSSDGLQEWQAMVDMPLWLPGQKQQQLLLSEKLASELPAYKQQLKLEASGKVRQAIWQVILANTVRNQAYQIWQTALQLEHDVTSRVAAGDLASTEGLLANTHTLEKQGEYMLAQAQLDKALAYYHNLTGETVLPEHYREALSETLIIQAQHPSLAILDQVIDTQRTHQDLAQFDTSNNPNLSLGIKTERGAHEQSFNSSIGVAITFAVDNDVYRRPAIANAAKTLADMEITRQQRQRDLAVNLTALMDDLHINQQQLEIIDQQEKAAQHYLTMQQRAFDLGEINLAHLINSQEVADKIHHHKQMLDVTIQYLIAQINQAVGIIL